jgi:hypothetical protein
MAFVRVRSMLREMNDDAHSSIGQRDASALLPWPECDLFCIHDYAGAGGKRCGWRGRLRDARKAVSEAKLLCPNCGCATLLRIPMAHGE